TMTTATRDYRVVGQSPVRPDGIDKVTGYANYGADIKLPGMLHARLKASPHAHAIIKKIDYSKALALPGVHAVVIGTDFPDPNDDLVPSGPGTIERRYLIGNFIAIDKVVFYGHPVAAVAAESWHIAEDALDLIEVEYEVLPPVMSAPDAIKPDAPILHPQIRTKEPLGSMRGEADENGLAETGTLIGASDGPSNVSLHLQTVLGDVEAGFAEAEIIVEGEFHNDTAHQGYLEPHTATASWSPDGSLSIWSSSQGIFAAVRDPLGIILKMPPSRIKVTPMEIGGGFGGKNRIYCEPIAAMLSKKAGRPVQLTMTRTEVIQASGPAAGVHTWAKIGAKRDGTLVAAQTRMLYEAGGFPGAPVAGGLNTSFAAYNVPNVQMDGYDIVVNRPRNAAYRAPGAPGPNFAVESLIDELAERLDVDPMDLRLQNAAVEGTQRPNGTKVGITGNVQVMQAIKDSAHYRSELSGPYRGRGVAVGFWGANSGVHPVNAMVNADGRVILNAASMDIGGLRAAEAQVMAELLGIPYEDVQPRYVDTDSIGFAGLTAGSGTASGISASVYRVAMQIKERLTERAATIWGVEPSEVDYDTATGTLSVAAKDGQPAQSMTFRELAAKQASTGGYISGHVDLGGATGAATYGGNIVDVEIDPDTGKVTILRYTCVQDVGQALHRGYTEGQIQGGAVQGIGMAISEEYVYGEDGVLKNASLLDYRMPTTLDTPMIETILVEVPHPGHPLGVRGVGECAIVPPLAAIANAIQDALGARLYQLPASPTVILEHLLGEQAVPAGHAAG
ncbi:MAG: xanthine dehydrogenase family protein molybdopterin-binding subunit, partial [Dehalococcoidia bacterium]